MTRFRSFLFQFIFISMFLSVSAFGMDTDLQRLLLTVVALLSWGFGEFYGRISVKLTGDYKEDT